MRDDTQPLARLQGVTVRFGRQVALNDVDFALYAGEVRALVGENGAGKSTLVNLLTHRLSPSAGTVEITGHPEINSPRSALGAGVAAVYQDLKLIRNLTGLENIFLGHELRYRGGVLRRRAMREAARELIEGTLGFSERILDAKVAVLSVAEQEAIAIARALQSRPRIVAFDEPSEAFAVREREHLFELVRRLKEAGLAVLYISHVLRDLDQVAETVTVLREGRIVHEARMEDVHRDEIIRHMIGETLAGMSARVRAADPKASEDGSPLLHVNDLTTHDGRVSGASLTVRAGEVVGVAGLEGSGRPEIVRAIAGLVRIDRGAVSLPRAARRPLGPRTLKPKNVWQAGAAFVPRDRHKEGIFPKLSVSAQITISSLRRFSRLGLLKTRTEVSEAEKIGSQLRIRAASYRAPVSSLSGGNQQKSLVGRALCSSARLLLLDDPGAAIDIRAKQDLYRLTREFVHAGGGALISSNDATELLEVCDRVLVMVDGRVADDISGGRLNEAELLTSQYGASSRKPTPPSEEEQ